MPAALHSNTNHDHVAQAFLSAQLSIRWRGTYGTPMQSQCTVATVSGVCLFRHKIVPKMGLRTVGRRGSKCTNLLGGQGGSQCWCAVGLVARGFRARYRSVEIVVEIKFDIYSVPPLEGSCPPCRTHKHVKAILK